MELNETILKEYFIENKPLDVDDLPIVYHHPNYIFRDESWNHIKKFTSSDKKYCWSQKHHTNYGRIEDDGTTIKVFSEKKKKNWNLFYYPNASASNFEFSFDIVTHQKLSEIQLSFMAKDLRNRYRFMIRDNECAVFEVICDGVFYRYICQAPLEIDLQTKHHFQINKIDDHYQLYVDNMLILSVLDTLKLQSGRDMMLIVYNKQDDFDVDCEISNIVLKNKKKYINKVGILTYHRSHNYGAYLQAYCLCNRLNQEKDIHCELIDYRTVIEQKHYSLKKITTKQSNLHDLIIARQKNLFYENLFNSFEKAYLSNDVKRSKEKIVSNDIDDFRKLVDNKYDVIIAGSDELWRLDGFRGYPTAYWLWDNLHAKKMSYAASSRSDFSILSKKEIKKLEKNLKTFEYISVRDKQTKDSIMPLVGKKKINLMPDPSFIYDLPLCEYNVIKKKTHILNHKKNILVMLSGVNDEQVANKFKKELGKKYNLISAYHFTNNMHNISDLSPIEWASMIHQADLVITNLFHGVCYSMIYNTPYVAIGSIGKTEKILSLASKKNDLKNRYIDNIETLLNTDLNKLVEDKMVYFDNSKYIKSKRKKFDEFLDVLNHSLTKL